MAYHLPRQHSPQHSNCSPPRISPLRQVSNASTNSSAYSGYSSPFPPSRTSTISSAASSGYQTLAGQKRDRAEAGMVTGHRYSASTDLPPTATYKTVRQSLRPLPQPPNTLPPPSKQRYSPTLDVESHEDPAYSPDGTQSPPAFYDHSPPRPTHMRAMSLPPEDANTEPIMSTKGFHTHHNNPGQRPSILAQPDFAELQSSSTAQLRTLSKLSQDVTDEGFSMSAPHPSVAGLQGRRQLKRGDSVRGAKPGRAPTGLGSEWSGRNWMDQQRQFLQAYEYLCHIGEAKEWIEDVIHKSIPPIVQLEEALRDGVTLAEIVQALKPSRALRIFRNPKLQYRHSDNVQVFFRYLDEVQLPELFRFEFIDLYEKKNIPKVIYCIHALSYVLFKSGIVDFKIGNLVGQLQFEHHELEKTQKGLDKAGVSVPNFSGMGANFAAEPEPEPEPIETEEERINRELTHHEDDILELQAQIRGCLVRSKLGDTMRHLWDGESMLIELQSRLRGDWARQIFEYRLNMRRFAVNLQSAVRGFVVRERQQVNQQNWEFLEPKVVMLQSLVRARKSRDRAQYLKSRMRREESGIREFQAAVRGALGRKRVDDHLEEVQHTQGSIEVVQAAVRGMIERRKYQEQAAHLRQSQRSVTVLQSAVRAMATRTNKARQEENLRKNTPIWRALQAVSRGTIQRQHVSELQQDLKVHKSAISRLQGHARAIISRNQIRHLRSSLQATSQEAVRLQAASRALILRRQVAADRKSLQNNSPAIVKFQAFSRAFLYRQRHKKFLQQLRTHQPETVQLQALARGMLVRFDVGSLLGQLDEEEVAIEALQAAIRGMLVRAKFAEKKRFFKENMDKVVKAQSYIRAKLQGQAYKSLTSGKNPPVGTVKNFVHLLNDSDFDFDEEIEVERLRKTVVQQVRQNEMVDQYIAQLDTKIALMVKNRIEIDEVVKIKKQHGISINTLLRNPEMNSKDPYDLKALNKNSRRKLELYQELFFILQSKPQYLARLFKKIREQATPEKESERLRDLTTNLFGHFNKRREEYYLIKLITRSIKEEVDGCQSLQDFLRGNFFWIRIFSLYSRSPQDRKYLRDLLGPTVKSLLDNPEVDLESDPLAIYHNVIQNEQLQTGQRSFRRPNITPQEAVHDPAVKPIYVAHLQDLREVVADGIGNLETSLDRMPYGVRYIAQQMFHHLSTRFYHEDQGLILQLVGHWVWKNYLQPAVLEPERLGVSDRSLASEHKKILGEMAKITNQIARGRLFSRSDNEFLQPLNTYMGDAIGQLSDIWNKLIDVPDAEMQFDIDEFNDIYAKTKPTLYIKMSDIFSIHHLVANDVAYICPAQDDPLRNVIRELGSVKANQSELVNIGASEICLTLNPKLQNTEDPDAEFKSLFMETKRCILYLIRVQSGTNLMEIMIKPVTPEDESRWSSLIRSELLSSSTHKNSAYTDTTTLLDLSSMTYPDLKRTALENIIQLESMGRLTKHNNYQDLLNAIAVDIRTKHRRRVSRARELESVRHTLGRLDEQSAHLEEKLKVYNDYIEQAMTTMQNKTQKKRFLLPFTKQWSHERELAVSGRTPKFGSYKYSAADLAHRSILVMWQGYSDRQWGTLDLTIFSNEIGVFGLEGSSGSIGIPGASGTVSLDELLQAQYNGVPYLEFFDEGGRVRVNVELFLRLVMRKFYKEGG